MVPGAEFTTLDTQNAVVRIMKSTENPTGRIRVDITGDISAGDVEIGYKDDSEVFVVVDTAFSAVGGAEFNIGSDEVWAKATGATPDINLRAAALS